jgi:hypothetical protein
MLVDARGIGREGISLKVEQAIGRPRKYSESTAKPCP